MDAILMVILFIFTLTGVFGYNSLRRKFAGIIGVGGSYVILLGVMLVVMIPGSIAARFRGEELAASTGEIILTIVIALLCLAYMAYVILTRCETKAQKIMLPFVACMIGAGFCWKLLGAIFLHMPMESGNSDTGSSDFKFPQRLVDPQGNFYELMNAGGDNANYHCSKTGQTVLFYSCDFIDGLPNGWGVR